MAEALATRCGACGTIFRVVPDQLRVSEGWVRCGRCAQVFNAGQALLDAETGAPRAWPLERRPEEAPSPQPEGAAAEPPPRAWADAPVTVESDLGPLGPEASFERTQVLEPAPQQVAVVDVADFAPAVFEPATYEPAVHEPGLTTDEPDDPSTRPFDVEAMIDSAVEPGRPGHADEPAPAMRVNAGTATGFAPTVSPVDDADDSEPADAPAVSSDGSDAVWAADPAPVRRDPTFGPTDSYREAPSFMRRAERAERWRRPGTRAALAALLLAAALGLAAQAAYVWRDRLAAQWPTTRTPLEQACVWTGCTVGAARMIEGLTVESSGLLRVGQSDTYQFSLALRNRAGIDLAVPAVELSLTDSQGKLLARRVLRAAELGASQPALAAGRDLPLQATLRSSTDPVAGYTIELFYP